MQYQRPGKVKLIEAQDPVPAANEVLVEVAVCGICGTDLHILADEAPSASPIILGHEFSGEVLVVGKNVTNLKSGMTVAIDPNNFCGTCEYCHRGKVNLCRNIRPIGILHDGGWAQYCVVPERQVYPVPEHLDPVLGALAEPLSCIIHGWDRITPVATDQSVLIMGAGLIGLLWAIFLRSRGLIDIHMTEPQPSRRNRAHHLGFSCIPPQSLGNSFDIIIDCSGVPSAIEKAQDHLKPAGKLLLFGITRPDARISLSPFRIFEQEWSILGSVINPFTFSRALDFLPTLGVNPHDLGIEKYALEEHANALAAARNGEVTKVMFDLRRRR